MIVLPVLAVVLTLAWWRARRIRTLTALTLAHRRLGADRVVVGGEGFVLERADAPAVLLLHGAGDTPQTLRYLGDALYRHGFHVEAPLLPGHGREVTDFASITADALYHAVRERYETLRRSHEWVGVIGLSMGGALAVQLAAANDELPALGLIAPYLSMPRRIRRAARLSWLWGPLVPILRSGDGLSVLDPVERKRNLAYGVFTASALRALYQTVCRAATLLPQVRTPTLFVQSREDNRIAVADAEHAFDALGANEKRLEWVTGASHVITVDYGRDNVIAMQLKWMQDHVHLARSPRDAAR